MRIQMRMRTLAAVAAQIALVALVVTACAGGMTPSADITTTDPAWRNWFTLDWTAEPEARGTRRLTGYVHNGYGDEAYDVRLLTQALDASGAVVGQQLTWASRIPPLQRSYFEVRNLPAAPEYRVTVWAFTFQESADWP